MARLLDKQRRDGSFPFDYRNAASTDIRRTFDRVRPGWNKKQEQQPAQPLLRKVR